MLKTRQAESNADNLRSPHSGATESGKSFTSKLITSQLLRLSSSATKREKKLAEQVQHFDTVLTAFGYAKTKANANASRFGRYTELHYDGEGRLCGAQVLTFGLDKRRMTRLEREERTFHVFYQMLAGASSDERDALLLEDVTSYALLNQSSCYRLPGGPNSDDSIMMEELRAAMKHLGFKSRHMTSIFTILSAILLLGNLQFSDHNGHDATFESAHIVNIDVLESVADLLAVEVETLQQALTQKSRFVKKEVVTGLLNAKAAEAQRDALMRDLYATLFAFIVETANHKISPSNAAGQTTSATLIAQLDVPGYQNAAGTSINGPAGAQAVPSQHEEFCTNLMAEMVQNWSTRRAFDDDLSPNAEQIADGVQLPPIVANDNTACLELLRGTVVGSVADRKPAGLLGAVDKAIHRVRSGKMTEEDDTALLSEMDTNAVHSSYVSSQTLYAAAATGHSIPSRQASGRFGVNHYQGTCIYTSEGFLEHDMDLFDAGFVSMLRGSQDPFIAKLFAGPSLATDSHPLDASIVVSAQVSARPLRRPTHLGAGALDSPAPLLDPTKMYGVTRQLNSTLSELLNMLNHAGRVWSVLCVRPNDINQVNSFDTRRVKSQVRALLLPDLIARKRNEFVAGMHPEDFCQRYADFVAPYAHAVGATEANGKIQAVAIGNAWRDGQDYQFGSSKVWLSYPVWRKLEDRLRAGEVEHMPAEEEIVASPSGHLSLAYPPEDMSRAGSFVDEKNDRFESSLGVNALTKQPSIASDPFRTPALGETESLRGDGVWAGAGAWDQPGYGNVNPGMAGAREKDIDSKDRPLDQLEEDNAITRTRKWWIRFVWSLTWFVPSFLLRKCGGLKRPDIRFAWREKLAIVMIIFFINAALLFIILGLGRILCPDMDKAWNESQLSEHNTGNDFYVSVAGKVYDITNFWRLDHSDYASGYQVDQSTMLEDFAGRDLTPFFRSRFRLAARIS